jgi:hypothetical protein
LLTGVSAAGSGSIAAKTLGWQAIEAGTFLLRRRYLMQLKIMEALLNEVIDRVIHTFGMMRNLSEDALNEARESLCHYLDTLSSAGETDPQRLAVCGLAYLRNRQDGPPPKFTGC